MPCVLTPGIHSPSHRSPSYPSPIITGVTLTHSCFIAPLTGRTHSISANIRHETRIFKIRFNTRCYFFLVGVSSLSRQDFITHFNSFPAHHIQPETYYTFFPITLEIAFQKTREPLIQNRLLPSAVCWYPLRASNAPLEIISNKIDASCMCFSHPTRTPWIYPDMSQQSTSS